jgi:hypothetical protein
LVTTIFSMPITIATLPVGVDQITATFVESGVSTSATPFSQNVVPAVPLVLEQPSANPVAYGTPVTLTVSVLPSNPLSGGVAPTGTVDFFDGTTQLDGSSVTLTGTTATFAAGVLAPGTHNMTAVYNGDANYAGAPSVAFTETVTPLGSTGHTYGAQQPVVGAHVYLYAAGKGGYNTASKSLLLGNPVSTDPNVPTGGPTYPDSNGNYYVVTDRDGGFSLDNYYTCHPGDQVYAYSIGGSTVAGNNSAAGFLAITGQCPAAGNFAAATPNLFIDEVTTVAAAYAFAGFATDALDVADDEQVMGNLTYIQAHTGMANAFANAANLADLSTGQALTMTPSGAATVPQATINALADILGACINSAGPTPGLVSTNPCDILLSTATAEGTVPGTAPTDTATAAINIAHHPGSNVDTLYDLLPYAVPFLPVLGTQLESENAKLKRLVSDLSLEKLILKDIASGNF